MNEAYAGPPPKKRPLGGAYVGRMRGRYKLHWWIGRPGSWFQMLGRLPVPDRWGRWAHQRESRRLEEYMRKKGVTP